MQLKNYVFTTSDNVKLNVNRWLPDAETEIKGVILFLSVLGLIVLGSFIVERKMLDMFYLLFIICCMIHYLYLSFKS